MKKVLFISTTFNSYYVEIIKCFNKLGFEVDWYSDRPSNSIFTRALIRINPRLLKRRIAKYSKKILHETASKKYDLVFVILGQSFDESFWKELRNIHNKAQFVYYLWDSAINFPCIEKNYKYFDKVYSFDKNDCQKYSFVFEPLFYTDQFMSQGNYQNDYDYAYIGTVKPGRYSRIKDLLTSLSDYGFCGYQYFYLHSKKVLFYYKIKYNKEFSKIKKNEIQFSLLSKENCFDIENRARIIVDVPQPGQFGLTIRVFEALGMKKKIITTNADIVNYDFYNEKNVYIVKDNEIDFNSVFFHSDYEELSEDIRNHYYILNWLKRIVN